MMKSLLFLVLAISCLSFPLLAASAAPGLAGLVSSDAEGPMEGVLVSAKKIPGTITVTVVSDSQGRYTFPPGRLAPGKYHLAIRAVGYEAAVSSIIAAVGKKETKADIKLVKSIDLAAQLGDVEWLVSMPGTDAQKQYLFRTCSHCHTLAPIMNSTYEADGWMDALARMPRWDQVSLLHKPVLSPDQRRAPFGNKELAGYLSSINLSSHRAHDFGLKTLPRPRGEDTRVIITEYDLPRPEAEPHDVAPDKTGMIWYQDFMDGIVGRLNTATGEVKEWRDPVTKPGYPSAFQDLEWDPQGNIWLGRHDWNGIAKFDVKAERFSNFDLPAGTKADLISVGGDRSVWAKDDASTLVYRVDPATGETTKFSAFPSQFNAKDYKGLRHHLYGITADSSGHLYEADAEGGNICRLDGKTGEVKVYAIPTPSAGPRRMHLDSEGRLWIGEYDSKTIGMFNTRTEQFREWPIPIPWYGPYDVVSDKEGYAWTGAMTSDLILRLNPQTGEFRKYLLPRLGVNVRRVEVNDAGLRPIFWVGENHQAKIASVEPLD
ncbi:MAG: carboxypeptidase regulatory-like domain-containing protein [Candidatus Acidiferrales bacterium]|jgi:streptogramin lyase